MSEPNGIAQIERGQQYRTHQEALRPFGYAKGLHQRGRWTLPAQTVAELGLEGPHLVWFPKLYATRDAVWKNEFVAGKELIKQSSLSGQADKHMHCSPQYKRILMAKCSSSQKYTFFGIYAVENYFEEGRVTLLRRTTTRIRVYQ